MDGYVGSQGVPLVATTIYDDNDFRCACGHMLYCCTPSDVHQDVCTIRESYDTTMDSYVSSQGVHRQLLLRWQRRPWAMGELN